jgi:hypothetical protein
MIMLAPALALPLQLWTRHRLGLAAALACWLLSAAVAALLASNPAGRQFLGMVAGTAALPLTLFYVFAVFAYGLDGAPIEGRQSGFPARQFTLPVRTAALVGWPMLCGTAAAAATWLAWDGLVFRPAGVELPLAWPAVLLAAVLAWLQAILWSPFGLPLVRLLAAVLVPTALVLVASAGVTLGVPEPLVTLVLAALVPPAYLAAWAGVARARRGDVPDWAPQARRPATVSPTTGPGPAFASPARAQLWYEWRLHGLLFPFLLLCLFLPLTGWNALLAPVADDVVAAGLFPFLARFTHETRVTFLVFHQLLVLPPFLAGVLSSGLGSLGPKFQASPFFLTRPLTAGALVNAKLRAATRSTLVAAGVTLLTALAWVWLTGTRPEVAGWWGQVVGLFGPGRALAIVVLAAAGLTGLTWLQLCGGMVLGMAGRVWAHAVLVLGIALIVTATLLGEWLRHHPESLETFLAALPWPLGLAFALKLLLAGWAARVALRRRLWDARPMAWVVGVWLVTAGCLLLLAAWLVPAGGVPAAAAPLGIVLALPLGGILAAPLALEWNRHR